MVVRFCAEGYNNYSGQHRSRSEHHYRPRDVFGDQISEEEKKGGENEENKSESPSSSGVNSLLETFNMSTLEEQTQIEEERMDIDMKMQASRRNIPRNNLQILDARSYILHHQ